MQLPQQYRTCNVLMTAKEACIRVSHTHTHTQETLSLTHRFLSNQYLPTASKVLNFSDVYMEQAITLLYKQNPFAHETRSRKQIKKVRKKRGLPTSIAANMKEKMLRTFASRNTTNLEKKFIYTNKLSYNFIALIIC